MTDIAATVIVPAAVVETARTIGSSDSVNPWTFPRALTTDPTGPSNPDAEITDYDASGTADAGLLALIAQLRGVVVNFTDTWQDSLNAADPQRYIIAEEM